MSDQVSWKSCGFGEFEKGAVDAVVPPLLINNNIGLNLGEIDWCNSL